MTRIEVIFYRIYSLLLKIGNPKNGVMLNSVSSIRLLTVLILINLFTILIYLDTFGVEVSLINFLFKYGALIPDLLGIGIFFLLYLKIISNGRFLKIIERYKIESDKARLRGCFEALSYIILTFLFLICFTFLMVDKSSGGN